jgi:nondiscriminating aspartyl-tRNA synthetase
MERVISTEIAHHVGERVCVRGWLQARRRLGGITFLVVRDGWGTVQAVLQQANEETSALLAESVIEVEGVIRAEAQAPGGVELAAELVRVITPVTEALPVALGKKEIKAALPTMLDHAVVVNRHPARRAVFKLEAAAMEGFRATLNAQGFTEIQSPKIVASATESGANVFQLNYFGVPAYLAQSPQFYKQIMVGVFERVFEVAPVFRAEPHDTTRHVNSYVSLDVEFGFIENHFTVMNMVREVLAGIFATMTERCTPELALLEANLPTVPAEIPFIHFHEAQEWIYRTHGVDVRHEPDLSPQDEKWLGEMAQKEYGSDFLFVVGYPMVKRPFYTHPNPQNPTYSNSFDLLFRGTELITGGQRLHLYRDYQAALQRMNLPEAPFETYLEAFRYGMPPHGGFAIGLERLLMQLLGLGNVRLATLFPRDLTRLTP